MKLVNCGSGSQHTLRAITSSFARSDSSTPSAEDCAGAIKRRPEGRDVVPEEGLSVCLWTSKGNLAHIVVDTIRAGDDYRLSARAEVWAIL